MIFGCGLEAGLPRRHSGRVRARSVAAGVVVLGATSHPVQAWVLQQARNLCMDLEDAGRSVKFPLHDRDASFTTAFDAVFQAAGARVVRSAVQAPRMISIMERWIGSCRRELLDRTLVWNQRHLMTLLREYEDFYNTHRPHRTLNQAAPSRSVAAMSNSTMSSLSLSAAARPTSLPGEAQHIEVIPNPAASAANSAACSERCPRPPTRGPWRARSCQPKHCGQLSTTSMVWDGRDAPTGPGNPSPFRRRWSCRPADDGRFVPQGDHWAAGPQLVHLGCVSVP